MNKNIQLYYNNRTGCFRTYEPYCDTNNNNNNKDCDDLKACYADKAGYANNAGTLIERNIAGINIYNKYYESVGIIESGCTAFHVRDSNDNNVILTAAHCIDLPQFEDYKGYKGHALFPSHNENGYILANTTIKYFYSDLDVAVLNYSTPKGSGHIPSLKISKQSTKVGEEVYIIGNAAGKDQNSYTKVQVREPLWVPGEAWCSPNEGLHIVTTGPVYGGNSGSPYLNYNGQVVGLVQCGFGEGFNTGSPGIVLDTILNGSYPSLPTINYYSDSDAYLEQYVEGINGFLADDISVKGIKGTHYITRSYYKDTINGVPYGPLETQTFPPIDVYEKFNGNNGNIAIQINPTTINFPGSENIFTSIKSGQYYTGPNTILNEGPPYWEIQSGNLTYIFGVLGNTNQYISKVECEGICPKGDPLPDENVYQLYPSPIVIDIGFTPSPVGNSFFGLPTGTQPWISIFDFQQGTPILHDIGIAPSKGDTYSITVNRINKVGGKIKSLDEFKNNYMHIEINITGNTNIKSYNYIVQGNINGPYLESIDITSGNYFNQYQIKGVGGGGNTFLTEKNINYISTTESKSSNEYIKGYLNYGINLPDYTGNSNGGLSYNNLSYTSNLNSTGKKILQNMRIQKKKFIREKKLGDIKKKFKKNKF